MTSTKDNLRRLAADVDRSCKVLAGPDYQAFSKHLKLLDDINVYINTTHNKRSCADCHDAPGFESLKKNQEERQKLLVPIKNLRKLLDDMEKMVTQFETQLALLAGADVAVKLQEFGKLTTTFDKSRGERISNLDSLTDDVWKVLNDARRKCWTKKRGDYEPDNAEVWKRGECETRVFLKEVAAKVKEMRKITAAPRYKNPEYQLFFDEVDKYQRYDGGRFPHPEDCIHGEGANRRLRDALTNMWEPGAIESEILKPGMLDDQIRAKFNNKVAEFDKVKGTWDAPGDDKPRGRFKKASDALFAELELKERYCWCIEHEGYKVGDDSGLPSSDRSSPNSIPSSYQV